MKSTVFGAAAPLIDTASNPISTSASFFMPSLYAAWRLAAEARHLAHDAHRKQRRAGDRGRQVYRIHVALDEMRTDRTREPGGTREGDRLIKAATRPRIPCAQDDQRAGGGEPAAESRAVV